MTSSRPYLIRAFYEWIVDNNYTPYIVINTEMPNVEVPREHSEEGKIVLNIAPDAVHHLIIRNVELEFRASFSGLPRHIFAPIAAVMAIYAKETGQGMVFGDEPGGDLPPDDTKFEPEKDQKKEKKSHLKVIK